MKKQIQYIQIILLGFFLTSCASSTTVGGSRHYEEGGVLKNRVDQCEGACSQFSSSGKCVEFSRGISEVCIDYFNNLEK